MSKLFLAALAATLSVGFISSSAQAFPCSGYSVKHADQARYAECAAYVVKNPTWAKAHGASDELIAKLIAEANARLDPLVSDAAGTTQYFVSQTGSGNFSGTSAGNALPWNKLAGFINTINVPARVTILSGTYTLSRATQLALTDKTQSKPLLKIVGSGVNTVFVGDYTAFADVTQPNYRSLFQISRSNLVLGNFSIHNAGSVIYVPNTATTKNVLVKNVVANDMGYGIVFFRNGSKVIDYWTIDNFHIQNYYEYGFRLNGKNTTNITIKNSVFDAGPIEKVPHDCFVVGVEINEGPKNITISDTKVINNFGGCAAGAYQQGDGIEASDGPYGGFPDNILLKNVTSIGNGDGSFDLKATNVTLDHPVAIISRPQHYAYRLWHYTYNLIDPTYDSSHGHDIQVMGAEIKIVQSQTPVSKLFIGCELKSDPLYVAGRAGVFVTSVSGAVSAKVCK